MMTDLDRRYSARVLSSPAPILALDGAVHRLMPERDITLAPHFFLSSLSREWIPRVAVVTRGDDVAGVVYAKERRVGGIPTGIVFADGRLGNVVVAGAGEHEDVLLCGIQSLGESHGVRALRLMIPPDGAEARAVARAHASLPVDLTSSPVPAREAHARLPLPADFQEFLRSLGYKTRRNFRHYRRRFEAAGHTFAEDVPVADLMRALTGLRTKGRLQCRTDEVIRAEKMIRAADRPWVVGLRHRDGDWLSVAAGWYSSGRAMMFLQLNNDLEHGDASLSVVLRAYLIETLIGKQVPELAFWSGTAPPLSRYAPPFPTIAVHLDIQTLGWRLIRSMAGRAEQWLPDWMSIDVRWIADASEPPGHSPDSLDEVEPAHAADRA